MKGSKSIFWNDLYRNFETNYIGILKKNETIFTPLGFWKAIYYVISDERRNWVGWKWKDINTKELRKGWLSRRVAETKDSCHVIRYVSCSDTARVLGEVIVIQNSDMKRAYHAVPACWTAPLSGIDRVANVSNISVIDFDVPSIPNWKRPPPQLLDTLQYWTSQSNVFKTRK